MPIRLDASAPDFAERFQTFLLLKRETAEDVEASVSAILADVAARGDAALIELSRKFDGVDLEKLGLRVPPDEIDAAAGACDPEAVDAMKLARDRIGPYYRQTLPAVARILSAIDE